MGTLSAILSLIATVLKILLDSDKSLIEKSVLLFLVGVLAVTLLTVSKLLGIIQ